VAASISDSADLLRGLVALRSRGEVCEHLVTPTLELKELKVLRIGWELWRALAEGDGVDPEALLLEHLPYDLVETAQTALWDDQVPDGVPGLRLLR
jgi:hypothetical protein